MAWQVEILNDTVVKEIDAFPQTFTRDLCGSPTGSFELD
jgi:hypothetical protein